MSQANWDSCARWKTEASNICSVMTLNKWFQVFFHFLEDALQMSKPQWIIIHLSLTLLNVAFNISKYWITAHHTPARQAITSQVNRQEMEAHRMTKWLFQHHDTRLGESEAEPVFLASQSHVVFLLCVAAFFFPTEEDWNLLRVCHCYSGWQVMSPMR